jgi:hypothetical protein
MRVVALLRRRRSVHQLVVGAYLFGELVHARLKFGYGVRFGIDFRLQPERLENTPTRNSGSRSNSLIFCAGSRAVFDCLGMRASLASEFEVLLYALLRPDQPLAE